MGPATGILEGVAVGMMSSMIPVVTIVFGILIAFGVSGGFAGGNEAVSQGLYGIGFAAVGMLATLGITLATDAYGPIADNAGGNAEMSGLGKEVRERTDALDMLGNTTAATGKGFAIGSAALTAMALLSAYLEEVKLWVGKYALQAGSGYFQIGTVKFYNNIAQQALDPTGVLVQQRPPCRLRTRIRHQPHEPEGYLRSFPRIDDGDGHQRDDDQGCWRSGRRHG